MVGTLGSGVDPVGSGQRLTSGSIPSERLVDVQQHLSLPLRQLRVGQHGALHGLAAALVRVEDSGPHVQRLRRDAQRLRELLQDVRRRLAETSLDLAQVGVRHPAWSASWRSVAALRDAGRAGSRRGSAPLATLARAGLGGGLGDLGGSLGCALGEGFGDLQLGHAPILLAIVSNCKLEARDPSHDATDARVAEVGAATRSRRPFPQSRQRAVRRRGAARRRARHRRTRA